MHPELMRALAIERQRSLLEGAQPASLGRRNARPMRRASTQRRSPILARLRVARPPTL